MDDDPFHGKDLDYPVKSNVNWLSTRLHVSEILGLCELINREAAASERTWPNTRLLGHDQSLTIAYARRL